MMVKEKKGKKGSLLEGTLVYLVIALLFVSMLFIFVYRKSSNTALIEEKTAKEIALMLDSARPGTSIVLNVDEAIKKNEGVANPIVINGNVVTVKLSNADNDKYVGYSYSFFNKFGSAPTATVFEKDGLSYINIKVK